MDRSENETPDCQDCMDLIDSGSLASSSSPKRTRISPRRASRAGSEMSRNTRFYKGLRQEGRFPHRRASRAGLGMSRNAMFIQGLRLKGNVFSPARFARRGKNVKKCIVL